MTNFTKPDFRLGRRGFLKAAAAGLATPAFASLPGIAQAQETVNLTFWAWTPRTENQVALFMEKYPHIKVTLESIGGEDQNTKLRAALRAGSGFPDVVQAEFQRLPSFRAVDALLDLTPYGANDVKDQFVDWSWESVSDAAGGVYAMPWDSGPMGLLYRADLFEAAGAAEVPGTWAGFAELAKKYAVDNPGKFLTNFGANNGGWMIGVLWQAGNKPFALNGTDMTIRINDEPAKAWAAYWQDLLDAKAVDLTPNWTPEWFTAFDNGTIASWIAAAWSPVQLTNVANQSVGKWRAGQLPQWKEGEFATSNWGGSTFSVIKPTAHPEEAALFATFMATDGEATRLYNTDQFLFPVRKELLADKDLMGTPSEFYGGQAVNEVFAEAAEHVIPGYQFSPFHDVFTSALQENVGAAVAGNGTLADALDRTQEAMVTYASEQGYTVIT
ncbi:sugar ABC transporter substrate-binding protein [Devosia sp.]|uniref:ABC transporter substrate-binding protein n=1 Tax=Devosia sp. TaxID=1871048 RepID=UPI001B2A8B68|nr:sugar ABC transporter substrate-binding protein [Devosia sp.]MBO9590280.1 sugar ABC transporter substrate-binding protein [Devosia sp.]